MFGTKRGETEKRGREKPDIPRECCLKRKKAPSKSRISVKAEKLSTLTIEPGTTVSIGENSTTATEIVSFYQEVVGLSPAMCLAFLFLFRSLSLSCCVYFNKPPKEVHHY